MRRILTHALAALSLAFAVPASADGPGDPGPNVAAPPVQAQPAPAPAAQPAAAPAAAQAGQITLDDVNLTIPAGYRFYPADDARVYLQRNNAASPNGLVLGLIARADADIRRAGTWATVVSYDSIGYVQPQTASGLSDTGFEEEVRAARAQQERPFEGFIATPAFTADTPKLLWAELSAPPGSRGADLRFEQKIPGRYGVAGLTSIGSADQLPQIQAAANELQGMLSFPAGRAYADFQLATDQISNFTVPGLVTGVATPIAIAAGDGAGEAQTGFGGLAGMFPWIAFGAIAVAVAGYMLMRRRGDEDEAEA